MMVGIGIGIAIAIGIAVGFLGKDNYNYGCGNLTSEMGHPSNQ
jgi:hypothetical protein